MRYVKAGVYKDIVTVTVQNLTVYGDGPEATIVTGNFGRRRLDRN